MLTVHSRRHHRSQDSELWAFGIFRSDNLRFHNPFYLIWPCRATEAPLSIAKKEKPFLDDGLLPQDCRIYRGLPAHQGNGSPAAGRIDLILDAKDKHATFYGGKNSSRKE